MLPTTHHVKELIEHAEEHLSYGSERDLKISLMHADNSIEILLMEHLRYGKEKSWGEIEHMNFYELLSSCKDISLVSSSKSFFLAFHDMRNAVYHVGTLVPMKKDVESAVEFAKTLFNELHPSLGFTEARIELPSEKSIRVASDTLGQRLPYTTELSLVRNFSEYLRQMGYEVYLEHPVAGYRMDLLARKEDDFIVCEVKAGKVGVGVGVNSVRQLVAYMDALRKDFPEKKIQGWLITNGQFTADAQTIAERLKIRLFDGQKLKQLFGGKSEG
jgi:HJR/Mrr/RecB family endonuclease